MGRRAILTGDKLREAREWNMIRRTFPNAKTKAAQLGVSYKTLLDALRRRRI